VQRRVAARGYRNTAAVADDVDLWSEFVKLEATVNRHVPLARRR
jgi:hypothetical protein